MRECYVQISFLFFFAMFFSSCSNQNPAGSNLAEDKKHDGRLESNANHNLASGLKIEPQEGQSGSTPPSQSTLDKRKNENASLLTNCYAPYPTFTSPAPFQHFQSSTAPVSVTYTGNVVDSWYYGGIWVYLDENEIGSKPNPGVTYNFDGTVPVGFGQHTLRVIACEYWSPPCYYETLCGTASVTFYVDPIPPSTAPYINSTWENNHPKIYWNAVTGATGYKIYKTEGSSSNSYWLEATTSSTSYVDDGEISFSSCSGCTKVLVYYKVTAYNAGGESPYSNIKQFAVGRTIVDP